MPRRAVVLMNLGGPDSLEAVQPFLFNLFSDPHIIGLPALLRLPLAWAIARKRARTAREIYAHLGGFSPLLANTEAQAEALELVLGNDTKCFVAMRYWRPFTADAVRAVAATDPDEIVLLPLYPQFSTTTTASSLAIWEREAKAAGLSQPTRIIRSYPTEPGFIAALADQINAEIESGDPESGLPRLLLSAHGLPLRIVEKGDPYPQDVEQTAKAVAEALRRPDLDWCVCYQSRVGPLAWLGPSIDEELQRAGKDRVPVIVAPISFVSEHSETLVELDRDYRRVAESHGVPGYRRARTVGIDTQFIAGLATLVNGKSDDALSPPETPQPVRAMS
jgi:ferrochelatase